MQIINVFTGRMNDLTILRTFVFFRSCSRSQEIFVSFRKWCSLQPSVVTQVGGSALNRNIWWQKWKERWFIAKLMLLKYLNILLRFDYYTPTWKRLTRWTNTIGKCHTYDIMRNIVSSGSIKIAIEANVDKECQHYSLMYV